VKMVNTTIERWPALSVSDAMPLTCQGKVRETCYYATHMTKRKNRWLSEI
jgi:hypothetical protein